MVKSMVERATTNMLIGPDWALNLEISDFCNSDPKQAKDVVKGVKKRLSNKNPKVQLLVLTLLETLVKNCGDIVHMHVAETKVLNEMVKIVRKRPDFHVKEKILILIDTWQEAFGGPRARYPQYFAAYQDLLRIGAVFPQRSESSVPVLTPPQTQPLSSYPQNFRTPDSRHEGAESSAESQFPTLSLTEIQNARGIMDVLAEMLNAINPNNKEGLKQDVLVDLVNQCRTQKQRVVHLVNSSSDESLLSLGLALNDDLERILAKHEAISSGTFVPPEKPKPELKPAQSLVRVDPPLIDTGDSKPIKQGVSLTSGVGTQKAEPIMDLLSGDDFSLAIVPVGGETQPMSPVSSDQNALALVDLFPQSNNNNTQSTYLVGQPYPSSPQFQQQNGNIRQYEQSSYTQGSNNPWNGSIAQHNRSPSLPLPPWEAQPIENSQSMMVPHSQPSSSGPYPQQVGMYPAQMAYMYQQQLQQQMYMNHMASYSYGYIHGQQQNAQFIGSPRMSGLSIRDDSVLGKSAYQNSTPSYVHEPSKKPSNPSNPQDKLFGDLVDLSKFKTSLNQTPGRRSM